MSDWRFGATAPPATETAMPGEEMQPAEPRQRPLELADLVAEPASAAANARSRIASGSIEAGGTSRHVSQTAPRQSSAVGSLLVQVARLRRERDEAVGVCRTFTETARLQEGEAAEALAVRRSAGDRTQGTASTSSCNSSSTPGFACQLDKVTLRRACAQAAAAVAGTVEAATKTAAETAARKVRSEVAMAQAAISSSIQSANAATASRLAGIHIAEAEGRATVAAELCQLRAAVEATGRETHSVAQWQQSLSQAVAAFAKAPMAGEQRQQRPRDPALGARGQCSEVAAVAHSSASFDDQHRRVVQIEQEEDERAAARLLSFRPDSTGKEAASNQKPLPSTPAAARSAGGRTSSAGDCRAADDTPGVPGSQCQDHTKPPFRMAVRQALRAARQDPSAAALERESAEGLPSRQSPGRERVTRPAAASAGQRATHQVVLGGIVAAAAAAVDPVAYQELLAGVLRDRAVSQSQAAADVSRIVSQTRVGRDSLSASGRLSKSTLASLVSLPLSRRRLPLPSSLRSEQSDCRSKASCCACGRRAS